ncbi:MAG TPA: serine--tRNA ligase, partial [Isosphaeraceae bacterium]|nr:serine--tRNA ligase [Isosphaeraceae bacterium]
MLDLKFVLANVEAVRRNCRDRNVPGDVLEDLDRLVALEGKRKTLLQEVESVRRRQNEVAQVTGREKDAARRQELVNEGKRLKAEVGASEDRLRQMEADLKRLLGRIPNMTHPDAPVGATEDESRELRQVGTPRAFEFTPRDHVELGKALD